jgi:hypothetical protein
MHVQYSNTLINILRITETHMLTCYRLTMGGSAPGDLSTIDGATGLGWHAGTARGRTAVVRLQKAPMPETQLPGPKKET